MQVVKGLKGVWLTSYVKEEKQKLHTQLERVTPTSTIGKKYQLFFLENIMI